MGLKVLYGELFNYSYSFLYTSVTLYFGQESEYRSIREIPLPDDWELLRFVGRGQITFEERIVILLALMPHLCPQLLDIFFVNNKELDRPYTEFGGWKGLSHAGFLPTGETAAFILDGNDWEKRKAVVRLFDKEHWFWKDNILRLEGQGVGEPFLSGQLRVSEEVLNRVFYDREYKPDYSADFPAKRITTALEWEDFVSDYTVYADLQEISVWLEHQHTILEKWGLKRFLKAGYRALFYGPPGTGKTLAATLIGKCNLLDVYRIDLSMVVSKYIGETEKNLARIFDLAENRDWILFFDEADALFGKRTSTDTSNDRHANQEVAYLLQRIEDFPGTVILATNLFANMDDAFTRRFQSVVYFPMPDQDMRRKLWQKMLPAHWLPQDGEDILNRMAAYELSGGSISNVIRRCAIQLILRKEQRLSPGMLTEAVQKELQKEKL